MQGSMAERDRIIMERIVREGDIRPEKAAITMELIIALHQKFSLRGLSPPGAA